MLADGEGPEQTARMGSLIWAFAVRICPKTRFRMARPTWRCDMQKITHYRTVIHATRVKKRKKIDMRPKYTDAPTLWPPPVWLSPLALPDSPTPGMIQFPNPGLC